VFAAYRGEVVGTTLIESAGHILGNAQPGDISVLLKGSDGHFGAALSHLNPDGSVGFGRRGSFTDVRSADFDGDGAPDVALTQTSGGLLLLQGKNFGRLDSVGTMGDSFLFEPRFVDVAGEPYPLVASRRYAGAVTLDA